MAQNHAFFLHIIIFIQFNTVVNCFFKITPHIYEVLKSILFSLLEARIMMEKFKDHFSISKANLSNVLSPTELEMNEKLQVIGSLIHLSLFIN